MILKPSTSMGCVEYHRALAMTKHWTTVAYLPVLYEYLNNEEVCNLNVYPLQSFSSRKSFVLPISVNNPQQHILFNTKHLSWILTHKQYLIVYYEVIISKLSVATFPVLLKHALVSSLFPANL